MADTKLRAVLRYDPDGAFIEELTPPRDANPKFRPCAVLVNGPTLFVGDSGHRRLARWDLATQQWLEPWAPPAGMKGLIAPCGIAATRDGTLLIADSVQGRVLRVTSDGRWLAPFGSPGRSRGQFVRPK